MSNETSQSFFNEWFESCLRVWGISPHVAASCVPWLTFEGECVTHASDTHADHMQFSFDWQHQVMKEKTKNETKSSKHPTRLPSWHLIHWVIQELPRQLLNVCWATPEWPSGNSWIKFRSCLNDIQERLKQPLNPSVDHIRDLGDSWGAWDVRQNMMRFIHERFYAFQTACCSGVNDFVDDRFVRVVILKFRFLNGRMMQKHVRVLALIESYSQFFRVERE